MNSYFVTIRVFTVDAVDANHEITKCSPDAQCSKTRVRRTHQHCKACEYFEPSF